jgi:hypothetical protein
MDCLRRKHAVKGVFVVRGQAACAKRVLEADWQRQIPCRSNDGNEIFNES